MKREEVKYVSKLLFFVERAEEEIPFLEKGLEGIDITCRIKKEPFTKITLTKEEAEGIALFLLENKKRLINEYLNKIKAM